MSEYKKFIKVWECIHKMNAQGIFDYGYAMHNGNGDILVEFDTESQKQHYNDIFGE